MDVHRTESAPDLAIDDRSKQGFVKWFRQVEAKDVQQGVSTLVTRLKTHTLSAMVSPLLPSHPDTGPTWLPLESGCQRAQVSRPRPSPTPQPRATSHCTALDTEAMHRCLPSTAGPRCSLRIPSFETVQYASSRCAPVIPQEDAQRLVRFFDQKAGVYSVHGASALFIARQYYKTTAVIKYYGSAETGLPGARYKV